MRLYGNEAFKGAFSHTITSAPELRCVADERGVWLPGIELPDELRGELSEFDPFGDKLDGVSEAEEFGIHFDDTGEQLACDPSSEGYMGYL
jgi:hypothetical protein